jgi:tRNA A37 threonylcarbamoyladenosine biosynthesis protein TsaE
MKPPESMTRDVSETAAVHAVLDQPALEAWGRSVGAAVVAGEIAPPLTVVLRGPLGAGKSVLARAIARGAGVSGPMPSPTYNLVFTYEGSGHDADSERAGGPGAGGAAGDRGGAEGAGPVVVNHLDLYRLEHPDDVWELGWRELGEGRQIVLVEWPERAEALLPPDRWEARLSFLDDDGGEAASLRRLEVRRLGGAPGVPSPPVGVRAEGDREAGAGKSAGRSGGPETSGDAP